MNNSFVELTQYMLRQAPMQVASYDATLQVCGIFAALTVIALIVAAVYHVRTGGENNYGDMHGGLVAAYTVCGLALFFSSLAVSISYTNRAEILASPTAWAEHQALKRMAGLQ
jgi:hypothetical protein